APCRFHQSPSRTCTSPTNSALKLWCLRCGRSPDPELTFSTVLTTFQLRRLAYWRNAFHLQRQRLLIVGRNMFCVRLVFQNFTCGYPIEQGKCAYINVRL